MPHQHQIFEDWRHHETEISKSGLKISRQATPADKDALTKALDLVSCEEVTITYELQPVSVHEFKVTGTLEADVTQSCVATLEPVIAHISEDLHFIFGPTKTERSSKNDELPVLDAETVEPIEDGVLDIGRLAFELISSALDSYPRKPGATFDGYNDEATASDRNSGPFAALSALNKTGQSD